jgi:ribonuclease HI
LLKPDGAVVEKYGGEPTTTNNRMELIAIREALHPLPYGCEVTVISDSRYAVNGLTIWRAGWRRRGWARKTGPMPNRDLWFALEEQLNRLRVRFQWVRGHSGDKGNERADALANAGRLQALQMETGSACIEPPSSDFRLLLTEVRVST